MVQTRQPERNWILVKRRLPCGIREALQNIMALSTSSQNAINNHTFTVDNLEALPMFVRTGRQHNLSERVTDYLTLFFNKKSPLSNFHASEFIVKDQAFSYAEQYIAYQNPCCSEKKQRSLKRSLDWIILVSRNKNLES